MMSGMPKMLMMPNMTGQDVVDAADAGAVDVLDADAASFMMVQQQQTAPPTNHQYNSQGIRAAVESFARRASRTEG